MTARKYVIRWRKAIVAVVGGAAELVALGVLHGTALAVAQAVVAVATAAGVYTVPNVAPEAGGK